MPKDPLPLAAETAAASAPRGRLPARRRALFAENTARIAAIDLGSNSFHLLVANVINGRLRIVTRRGVKVQLAAGLDADGNLDEAAMQRGLKCLGQFAVMMGSMPRARRRIVGTNALRDANNRHVFLQRAEALLGYPIEVIPGREEARLIYLGAAQARAVNGRRFVLDIGGGSSECVIGERLTPRLLESLPLGCVTFSRRFFPDGALDETRMRAAEQAALAQLSRLQHYRESGWDEVVGTSGTFNAVARVLNAYGDTPANGVITRAGVQRLRARVLRYSHLDALALKGLKANRAGIFPAGVAIVCAIFATFEIEQIRFVDGALREGILYDMLNATPDG
ncbi:MAG: Ppx/GppA family phosphatase [Halomonas subglaciescola]|nr:Ppx/GppA family phosphatase [Halomonas subglaciescola]